MTQTDQRALEFSAQQAELRRLAYGLLGSVAEAEDAVQESWLRLQRAGGDEIENLGGWLRTVVSRICLDALRARARRPTEPLWLPDPVVEPVDSSDPEHQALLADQIGMALLVVLEALTPAARIAFVLHDIFDVPFDEIARLLDVTPAAVRQLASRARRRVRQAAPPTRDDMAAQRRVVDAFFAASRDGDTARLIELLHPEVLLRRDAGPDAHVPSAITRGADAVRRQALAFATPGRSTRAAVVNGSAGALVTEDGRVVSVMAFLVLDERIAIIDVLADPARVRELHG